MYTGRHTIMYEVPVHKLVAVTDYVCVNVELIRYSTATPMS